MGRHSLRIIMVLGALVTVVGGTGIFAVFTDQATTGTNSVTSGSRAHAADLQISDGVVVGGAVDCDPDQSGTYDEDLTTGLFSVTGMQPGDPAVEAYVCLYNAGSADLSLVASVLDVVDEDVSCTGDEAAAGDTSCGSAPAGQPPSAGELGSVLALQIETMNCGDNSVAFPLQSNSVVNWVANPVPFVTIDGDPLVAGEVMCLRFLAFYPSSTPETSIQLAQSDRVQWRLAFDGTAIE